MVDGSSVSGADNSREQNMVAVADPMIHSIPGPVIESVRYQNGMALSMAHHHIRGTTLYTGTHLSKLPTLGASISIAIAKDP